MEWGISLDLAGSVEEKLKSADETSELEHFSDWNYPHDENYMNTGDSSSTRCDQGHYTPQGNNNCNTSTWSLLLKSRELVDFS